MAVVDGDGEMNDLCLRLSSILKRDAALDDMAAQLTERLAEDESWQGGMTDDERKAALAWASEYLHLQLDVSLTITRKKLKKLGELMQSPMQSLDHGERGAVLRAWLE